MYPSEIKIKVSGNCVTPDHPYTRMSEIKSTTWEKLFEVPTKARTVDGIIAALRNYTDFYNELSDDEMLDIINSVWTEICSDGIIVWEDRA